MGEDNRTIHISDAERQDDFDLEDILAEYHTEQPEPESPKESLADRSKRLVQERLGNDAEVVNLEPLNEVIESEAAEAEPENKPDHAEEALPDVTVSEPEIPVAEQAAESSVPVETADNNIIIENPNAVFEEQQILFDSEEEYPDEEDEQKDVPRRKSEQKSVKEKFASPFVAVLALISLRISQRKGRLEREKAERLAAADRPEPPPEKAAHQCAALMTSLRFRGRIALILSLIAVYLSYAASSSLPLTGALKSSPRVLCLMLLVLDLSVCMAGLDIFTEGLLSLFRGRPGKESLVSVSCVLSALDAMILAIMNNGKFGLPFCAVSALSMTFAIWGAFWNQAARRTSYRVLTSSKNLYTVSGEKGIAKEVSLLKSRRGISGFINRTEDIDFGELVFGILSPILMVAALILGLIAAIVQKAPKMFVHCVSMLAAASSSFSIGLCFAVPYAAAAKRFAQTGATVAGWPGIRDIGKSRHVVITDLDVFPKGTVEISNIRVLEGAFVDKVISYTASVVASSGSGLAVPFADLVRRNGYSLSNAENFEAHDGGGMTAMVNGESVCVGNTGFMNLMGIRVPQKISTKNSLYTAINGALVGIFTAEYRATGSVQEALVTLLHSSMEPIFAIRDFNITPMMLKEKFRMPTDGFRFPAYSERYRISGSAPDSSSSVAAAIAREGMAPLVDAAERGRRLYSGIRAGTIISAIGCVFGLLMMFLLSWTQTFDNATVGNVITFMLLWLIPTLVIVWGVRR